MDLFQECVVALSSIQVISMEETERIFLYFQKEFIFTNWARIDWKLYPSKMIVETIEEIQFIFRKKGYKLNEEHIYILWDEATLPAIQCTLKQVLKNIDDVIYVSFDTWL